APPWGWYHLHMRPAAFLSHVMDFCYPGACAICQAHAPGSAALCETCGNELRLLERAPACDRCAMPLPQHEAPCPHCNGKGLRPFERILRLGVFADPLKHLVHQSKYHHRWPLGEFLADRLLEQERVKGLLMETDGLVAVPLHPVRHIHRGYNQAEVIARRLSKICRLDLVRPAVRLRNTQTQTHVRSHAKREENLRDAFGLIDAKNVRGRHVVVIDDVMTTGATLKSFARCLKEAEPASLSALVVAIADPRERGFEVV
ncbi:MAG: ComF family protein, partial [Tepidisphaeraceae bacterium]